MTIKEFKTWLEKHEIDEYTELAIWVDDEKEPRNITEKNLLDCWATSQVVITDYKGN